MHSPASQKLYHRESLDVRALECIHSSAISSTSFHDADRSEETKPKTRKRADPPVCGFWALSLRSDPHRERKCSRLHSSVCTRVHARQDSLGGKVSGTRASASGSRRRIVKPSSE